MTTVSSRGFWAMRDLPFVAWFTALALSVIFRASLPWPTWLVLHVLFLGAITHAILVFSSHFTNALTRTRISPATRLNENVRLAASNAGAILVLIGVPTGTVALTVAGTTLLVTAVFWHAVSLIRRYRASLSGQFTGTVRYYVVAALLLPVGLTVGLWMILPGESSPALTLAHAIVNLFGWVGLTVAGTLVTLWPTMLRTRAAEHSARGGARALPFLAFGVVVAPIGAALSISWLVAIGCAIYTLGFARIVWVMLRTAKSRRPHSMATWSVGAAIIWWSAGLVTLSVVSLIAVFRGDAGDATIAMLRNTLHQMAPFIGAGFVAQILIGALSYLVPVLGGGGPNPVRTGARILEVAAKARVGFANAALLGAAVFTTAESFAAESFTAVAPIAWGIVFVALGSFLPILLVSWVAQRRAPRGVATTPHS